MNDILVGIVAWIILLGTTVWLYLVVKMLINREWNDSTRVVTLKENLDEVMASDE